MALLRIKTASAILFQLLRKNLAGNDQEARQWQEVSVTPMAVLPSTLNYEYGGRSVVTQTEPDSAFIDRYGLALTRVRMSGTFGIQPRRVGASIKDGYTRLLDFRDEVFKLSHQARALKSDAGAKYVYAINYYDFIYDERFCVNLERFLPEVDARRNAFEPIYQLSFQSIGPLIEIQTQDVLLAMLLDIDAALKGGVQALSDAIDFLNAQPGIQVGASAIDAILTGLDVMNDILPALGDLGAMYTNAIAGQVQELPDQIVNPARSFITSIKG